jgi:hypothetical protein
MSPTGIEIALACEVPREQVSLAVSHVRAVRPQLFEGVTKVDQLVTPQDRAPYMDKVDDYPASLVAVIVRTLRNM